MAAVPSVRVSAPAHTQTPSDESVAVAGRFVAVLDRALPFLGPTLAAVLGLVALGRRALDVDEASLLAAAHGSFSDVIDRRSRRPCKDGLPRAAPAGRVAGRLGALASPAVGDRRRRGRGCGVLARPPSRRAVCRCRGVARTRLVGGSRLAHARGRPAGARARCDARLERALRAVRGTRQRLLVDCVRPERGAAPAHAPDRGERARCTTRRCGVRVAAARPAARRPGACHRGRRRRAVLLVAAGVDRADAPDGAGPLELGDIGAGAGRALRPEPPRRSVGDLGDRLAVPPLPRRGALAGRPRRRARGDAARLRARGGRRCPGLPPSRAHRRGGRSCVGRRHRTARDRATGVSGLRPARPLPSSRSRRSARPLPTTSPRTGALPHTSSARTRARRTRSWCSPTRESGVFPTTPRSSGSAASVAATQCSSSSRATRERQRRPGARSSRRRAMRFSPRSTQATASSSSAGSDRRSRALRPLEARADPRAGADGSHGDVARRDGRPARRVDRRDRAEPSNASGDRRAGRGGQVDARGRARAGAPGAGAR